MIKDMVNTACAVLTWGTHPWRNPSSVGDDFDLPQVLTLGSARQAKKFAKRNPNGLRYRIGATVYYDRDQRLTGR